MFTFADGRRWSTFKAGIAPRRRDGRRMLVERAALVSGAAERKVDRLSIRDLLAE